MFWRSSAGTREPVLVLGPGPASERVPFAFLVQAPLTEFQILPYVSSRHHCPEIAAARALQLRHLSAISGSSPFAFPLSHFPSTGVDF